MLEFLVRSNLFAGLPEEYLRSLLPFAREVSVKQGAHLFIEGEETDQVYLITSGELVLEMIVNAGNQRFEGGIPLVFLGPPQTVGFWALIPPYREALSAKAVVDTACIAVDCAHIRERIDTDPIVGNTIRKNLNQLLAKRLHQARTALAYERATRLI